MKANQGNLHDDIAEWFAYADHQQFAGMTSDHHQTINKGHGRIEIRQCWVIDDPLAFEYIRHHQGWADLHSIARVQRERRLGDTVEQDTAYYISSLPANASLLLKATRDHWAIENSLHWVLDVTFRKDESRIRKDNAPQNFAVLRHIALNILKRDPSKGSLRQKRYQAALNEDFLFQVLSRF